MPKDIKQLLKEATKDILTDESLNQIQEAFDTAVTLHVESALDKQDADYTEKTKALLEALDADHAKKLIRVVEAQDKNNANKLLQVVRKYSKTLTEDAKNLREYFTNNISKYLDVYLEKTVPQTSINEAVKNKKAAIILKSLRESLSIDSALMTESVREGILDGKAQIQEAQKELETAKQQLAVLKENLAKTQANLILEQKTAALPEKKKAYAKRVLGDKSPKFILENIDYTLGLYDSKEDERLETLKEEAFSGRTVKEDAIKLNSKGNAVDKDGVEEKDEILEESNNNFYGDINPYLSELQRY